LHINVRGKDGLNTIGKPVHEDSEIVGTESVLITTLDGFLREHSISQVDVMKVDAEGAELMVFRGSKELLAKPNAPLILYESGPLTRGFGYHPVETVWLLELHGYSFFKIDSMDGRITALNGVQIGHTMLIAVKPSHPSYPTLRERARCESHWSNKCLTSSDPGQASNGRTLLPRRSSRCGRGKLSIGNSRASSQRIGTSCQRRWRVNTCRTPSGNTQDGQTSSPKTQGTLLKWKTSRWKTMIWSFPSTPYSTSPPVCQLYSPILRRSIGIRSTPVPCGGPCPDTIFSSLT